jgi:hypothetical protein
VETEKLQKGGDSKAPMNYFLSNNIDKFHWNIVEWKGGWLRVMEADAILYRKKLQP